MNTNQALTSTERALVDLGYTPSGHDTNAFYKEALEEFDNEFPNIASVSKNDNLDYKLMLFNEHNEMNERSTNRCWGYAIALVLGATATAAVAAPLAATAAALSIIPMVGGCIIAATDPDIEDYIS